MAVSGTTGRVFFLPAEVAQAADAAQVTDVDMAKQHFAAANGYYKRGEYEKAIEEFSKAYDLSKRPELNYNIAVCYEKLVKVKDAIAAYKLYLEEAPNAPDVEQVKSRITFLEEQISAGNAAANPVPEMVNPHAPEGVKSEVEQPPQTIIIEVKPPPKDEIPAPPERTSAYRKLMWASAAAAATAGGESEAESEAESESEGEAGRILQISAGLYHSCAVLFDHTVKCWGSNTHGRLGDGTTIEHHSPAPIVGLSDVVDIAAGYWHACSRSGDNAIHCWGEGNYGELGNSGWISLFSPSLIPGFSRLVEFGLGGYHSCARLDDDTAQCWGFNNVGQLGDGTTTAHNSPTPVVW